MRTLEKDKILARIDGTCSEHLGKWLNYLLIHFSVYKLNHCPIATSCGLSSALKISVSDEVFLHQGIL